MPALTSGLGSELTPEALNARGLGYLPALIGLRILAVSPEALESGLDRCAQLVFWPA